MPANTQPPVDSKDDELSRLKHKLLYDWFIHEESCDYSMTGSRECDCVQSKVADNVLPLIKQYGIAQRIAEHTDVILPLVEEAHEYEQQEGGSGIQYFDNERLGRLNALKSKETPS